MTTYQDPPLQSRRAVRQGERSDARTAAGAGEPLSYVTQNRPPLPGYDSSPLRGRRSSEPGHDAGPADAETAAVEAEVTEQPAPPQAYRPRDFSPEARTAPSAWSPERDDDHGVVEYHTQSRIPTASPVAVPPVAAPPVAAPPVVGTSLAESLASEPNEHTLTRRELRALREAQGLSAPVIDEQPVALIEPEPGESPVSVAPVSVDSGTLEPAPLEPVSPASEAPTRRAGRRAAVQSGTPEDALQALFAPPLESVVPEPVASESPEPVAVAPEPVAAAPQPVLPEPATPAVVLPPAPRADERPEFEAFPTFPAAPVAQPLDADEPTPTTGERPIGHWTTQSDIDDRDQVSSSTISRTIGSGALTTSALVLPALPGHDMATGDVMLTGSVSLPDALAATGAHRAIDESDIDHLLDPGDHQLVNTDSVPIRATTAVSSHSNQRGLVATGKPSRGNRALTALIVSASGMVLVVVTLLVVALATDVI